MLLLIKWLSDGHSRCQVSVAIWSKWESMSQAFLSESVQEEVNLGSPALAYPAAAVKKHLAYDS